MRSIKLFINNIKFFCIIMLAILLYLKVNPRKTQWVNLQKIFKCKFWQIPIMYNGPAARGSIEYNTRGGQLAVRVIDTVVVCYSIGLQLRHCKTNNINYNIVTIIPLIIIHNSMLIGNSH